MQEITPQLLQQLPEEIREQLKTISASKFYITLIIIGILLSLHSVNLQEEQLICSALSGEECDAPGLLPTQLTSSTLVLAAVVFFYQLASQAVCSSEEVTRSQKVNLSASTLTLVAGVMRFLELLRSGSQRELE
ncbi:MAG: hypothetical protein HFE85_03780 [Clostridiales bacterium]|nr:hypothetical protein [Clostridiales bacterium]